MSKRLLQYITAVLGLIPIVTGLIHMVAGLPHLIAKAATGVPEVVEIDSNLRFFGGLWFGLGLSLLWIIPRIDTETAIFRIFWGMIFLGGIGRVMSMLMVGIPAAPFIGFTVLEVIGAPLFILWQNKIKRT